MLSRWLQRRTPKYNRTEKEKANVIQFSMVTKCDYTNGGLAEFKIDHPILSY